MNNDRIKKGIAGLQEVQITSAEKQAILMNLMERIKTSPELAPQNSWLSNIFTRTIWNRRLAPAIAVCLIFLLASGGTLLASETALPGDFLYPLKINVAEPAGDILTIGTSAKTKRAAEKVDRRLNEAEKLVSEGRLTPTAVNEVQKQLTSQINKFNDLNRQLEKTAPLAEVADLHSNYEARITAHSQVLTEVGNHSRLAQKKEIDLLVKTVDEKVASAQKDRDGLETKLTESKQKTNNKDQSSFERSKKDVTDYIKKTQQQINKDFDNAHGLTKDILSNASDTLSEAQQNLSEAVSKDQSGDQTDALKSLLSAKRKALEADISARKSKDFQGQADNQNRQDRRDNRQKERKINNN